MAENESLFSEPVQLAKDALTILNNQADSLIHTTAKNGLSYTLDEKSFGNFVAERAFRRVRGVLLRGFPAVTIALGIVSRDAGYFVVLTVCGAIFPIAFTAILSEGTSAEDKKREEIWKEWLSTPEVQKILAEKRGGLKFSDEQLLRKPYEQQELYKKITMFTYYAITAWMIGRIMTEPSIEGMAASSLALVIISAIVYYLNHSFNRVRNEYIYHFFADEDKKKDETLMYDNATTSVGVEHPFLELYDDDDNMSVQS